MEQPHKSLWEILVPRQDNAGLEYALDHHRSWDTKVREIAGGLTILKSAKGQWVGPEGTTFIEPMIPVRIYCTEPQIDRIVDITMTHYDQLAVLAYEISRTVKLKSRSDTVTP